MQTSAESILLPPGVEPIADKIGSGFSYFKGIQYQTWLLVVSPFVLKAVLPKADYENWLLFVSACRLILNTSIAVEDVDEAHDLFVKFGKGCVRLYGVPMPTYNMHMHTHLKKYIKAFSNPYGFWLYNFERMNRLLKNINTNNKGHFELTMINSFYERKDGALLFNTFDDPRNGNLTMTTEQVEFLSRVSGYTKRQTNRSVIQHNQRSYSFQELDTFYQLSSYEWIHNDNVVTGSEPIPLLQTKAGKMKKMDEIHFALLLAFYKNYAYKNFFDDSNNVFEMTDDVIVIDQMTIAGQLFRSACSTVPNGSHICAFFKDSTTQAVSSYPGQIQFFFIHYLTRNGVREKHTFCLVHWFKNLGSHGQSFEKASLEFWLEEEESYSEFSILPAHRIYSHVAIAKFRPVLKRKKSKRTRPETPITLKKPKVLVIPLEKKLYM